MWKIPSTLFALSLIVNFTLGRDKELLTSEELKALEEESLDGYNDEELIEKFIGEYRTPTKYLGLALAYYNMTIDLEARVSTNLQMDYLSELNPTMDFTLNGLRKLHDNLQTYQYTSELDVDEFLRAIDEEYELLFDISEKQHDEAKNLNEKDFNNINAELKLWLQSQKNFADNWINIFRSGLKLYEEGDETPEIQNTIMNVDQEITLSSISTLSLIHSSFKEIDDFVDELENKIAKEKAAGTKGDNAEEYKAIMMLDENMRVVIKENSKVLSKFKKVCDAARNRMKKLVEEHDEKYLRTSEEIARYAKTMAEAQTLFQNHLKLFKERQLNTDATKETYSKSYTESRVEL